MDSYKRPAEPVKGSGSWWCLPFDKCHCRHTGIEKMVAEGLLDVLASMPEDGLGVIHNRMAAVCKLLHNRSCCSRQTAFTVVFFVKEKLLAFPPMEGKRSCLHQENPDGV